MSEVLKKLKKIVATPSKTVTGYSADYIKAYRHENEEFAFKRLNAQVNEFVTQTIQNTYPTIRDEFIKTVFDKQKSIAEEDARLLADKCDSFILQNRKKLEDCAFNAAILEGEDIVKNPEKQVEAILSEIHEALLKNVFETPKLQSERTEILSGKGDISEKRKKIYPLLEREFIIINSVMRATQNTINGKEQLTDYFKTYKSEHLDLLNRFIESLTLLPDQLKNIRKRLAYEEKITCNTTEKGESKFTEEMLALARDINQHNEQLTKQGSSLLECLYNKPHLPESYTKIIREESKPELPALRQFAVPALITASSLMFFAGCEKKLPAPPPIPEINITKQLIEDKKTAKSFQEYLLNQGYHQVIADNGEWGKKSNNELWTFLENNIFAFRILTGDSIWVSKETCEFLRVLTKDSLSFAEEFSRIRPKTEFRLWVEGNEKKRLVKLEEKFLKNMEYKIKSQHLSKKFRNSAESAFEYLECIRRNIFIIKNLRYSPGHQRHFQRREYSNWHEPCEVLKSGMYDDDEFSKLFLVTASYFADLAPNSLLSINIFQGRENYHKVSLSPTSTRLEHEGQEVFASTHHTFVLAVVFDPTRSLERKEWKIPKWFKSEIIKRVGIVGIPRNQISVVFF